MEIIGLCATLLIIVSVCIIITKLRYIIEETQYYIRKKSLNSCLEFVIQNLWYDIAEYTFFINRYHFISFQIFRNDLNI